MLRLSCERSRRPTSSPSEQREPRRCSAAPAEAARGELQPGRRRPARRFRASAPLLRLRALTGNAACSTSAKSIELDRHQPISSSERSTRN